MLTNQLTKQWQEPAYNVSVGPTAWSAATAQYAVSTNDPKEVQIVLKYLLQDNRNQEKGGQGNWCEGCQAQS